LQRYADALEADKGGAENVSAAERSMIEVAAMARGCASLILSCAGQYGVVEPADDGSNRWNISPRLRELPRFLKTEASALLGRGLERRSREIKLADYLEAKNGPRGMTILDALRDPHLFGFLPAFRDQGRTLDVWTTSGSAASRQDWADVGHRACPCATPRTGVVKDAEGS
jgi:hypothetical protein